MQTKPIPSTNEAIPVIGLGTWQTFDVSDSKPLEEVLRAFVAAGGKLIDSSPMYGRSERVAGDLATKLNLHSSLFIATKVWTRGKAAGIAQMENSMRELETRRIDLMQVHNLVDVNTHLVTLRDWKRAGKIRYIGITHYTAGAYSEVESILKREPVDFLQINYSLAEPEAEQRLLPLAAEKRLAVIANRPFASGGLFAEVRNKPLPSWAAEIECQSWAQVFLKWIVSHPAITCAIPATSKLKHLEDNVRAGFGRLLIRRCAAASPPPSPISKGESGASSRLLCPQCVRCSGL